MEIKKLIGSLGLDEKSNKIVEKTACIASEAISEVSKTDTNLAQKLLREFHEVLCDKHYTELYANQDLERIGVIPKWSMSEIQEATKDKKFLELNMRKGYSYKEIIEGRFDVKVRYADLLLPEFFGGFSRDINMNAITQTVDKDDNGLGSYKDARLS